MRASASSSLRLRDGISRLLRDDDAEADRLFRTLAGQRFARFRGSLSPAVCSLPRLVRLQGEAWGALVLQRGSAYAMTGLSAGSERVGAQQPPWEVGVAPGEAASFWRSSSRLVSLMEARMASRIARRSGPISSASR